MSKLSRNILIFPKAAFARIAKALEKEDPLRHYNHRYLVRR